MIATNARPNVTTDAQLVAASRGGDRNAFGQIVRRYQGLVSGLIYASCGDVHQSEDVAQETFVSAWKSLSGLRDASKLPGWLCQIARHRLVDHSRSAASEKARLFEGQELEHLSSPPPPELEAIRAEENQLLWKTLLTIPQPYRETLVLYYRQEKSAAQVAQAMETTEEVVRQRLTRGRALLRDEMAAALERQLSRSAPGENFSLAVVAALPAMTVAQGSAAAMMQGSAAKGMSLFAMLAAWAAPVLTAGFMIGGTVGNIRRAATPRQRRIMATFWAMMWLIIVGWVVAFNLLIQEGRREQWSYAKFVGVSSVSVCLYCMFLSGLMAWKRHRSWLAERQEGVAALPPRIKLPIRIGIMAPMVFVTFSWILHISIQAGDSLSVAAIVAAMAALTLWSAHRLPRISEGRSMLMVEWLAFGTVLALVLMNLRLPLWIAATHKVDLAQIQAQLPLWGMNVCGAVLLVWLGILAVFARRWSGVVPNANPAV